MDLEAPEDKKYGIIYSDPPWPQKKGNLRKARPNQLKSLDYETMPVKECFMVQDAFLKMADERHNVFLWAIDKFLHEIEAGMESRGYKLHARMIWDKGNGCAPAYTVRFSHEYLLWFYKPGRMLKPRKECWGKYSTIIRENSTYHSHKPLCVYEMIEDMFPDANKIELFARNIRPGWTAWGKEVSIISNLSK